MASASEIAGRFRSLPKRQKVALAVALTLAIASVIFLVAWTGRTEYKSLYSNLTEEDRALIEQRLREMGVPYKVTSTGIMVPSDRLYPLRLKLASEGLPQAGVVGFEIFDKTNFTMTDFLQKVNYQRALQGELSRTIQALSEVQQCRVHLSLPEKTLFGEEERPKASVVLKLRPGVRLSKKQIQGIVHLVASSVEGLTPQDVTIIDSRGNLLTRPRGEDFVTMTASQLEFQNLVERYLEDKIVGLLEPVVGDGKVRAKVSTSLDFTKIEKREELYDPDSQVARSEQKKTEKSTKTPAGGVPGVKSNLPASPFGVSGQTGYTERKNEIINYEISKVVRHLISPPGTIKRITAVVLVDGKYKAEGGDQQYIPRTKEELESFEEMVKKAIGYDEKRGDEVKVVNLPFGAERAVEPTPVPERKLIPDVVFTLLRYLIPVLVVLMVLLFVVRPLVKVLTTPPPTVRPPSGMPMRVEEVERMMLPEGASKEQVVEWARRNPQKAAQLVKYWLEEG